MPEFLETQVWAVPFLLLVSVLCAGQAPFQSRSPTRKPSLGMRCTIN